MKLSIKGAVGAAALLATIAVIVGVYRRMDADKPVKVKGTEVTRGLITSYVKATGLVETQHELGIVSPYAGTVAQLSATVGRVVKKGDLVALLGREEIDERIRVQEAAVRVGEEEVSQAERKYRVAKNLFEARGEALGNVEDLNSAMLISRAKLEQSRAELERARGEWSRHAILAPVDGVVTSVDVNQGEFAQAGRLLLHIAVLDRLAVKIKVDQALAAQVSVGEKVEIESDTESQERSSSTVERVEPELQKEGATYFLVAWAPLSGGRRTMRLHQQVNVKVIAAMRPDALRVPAELVSERKGKEVVRVIRDGHLAFQEVRTGIQDGQNIEITQGLAVGQIVLFPDLQTSVAEGALVALENTPGP